MGTDLAVRKAEARKAAFARRKAAHAEGQGAVGAARLLELLEPYGGKTISGFLPIRTEIDPRPAMTKMAESSFITVPVIEGAGLPLKFSQWTPGCALIDGPFGAQIPAEARYLEPEVLIVPLVAFDRTGNRLGYGGGFYDRTLERLRAIRKTIAIGFAFSAQEDNDLPLEETDQPLDFIVTEKEIVRF
ncbi:5-formyltetrahydrofolate cyclo-ligase [Pseudohalocynthiibacter aestuariivivens]|jgi:5-formyltetrahydrofolate cyclo-ligase|uniref:5-formyltetrahydrofolate cyclo-ligase n=1 Tax=Pseudohalocynthiibacter aestuariivivens TaxID=1591409 RepID=A0ABV5JB83_9RHOB|nr:MULTISPECIES: 5-formyltetrahydrofolate cyclo-ligase [Pseudohalocynthiibacter]MBS9715723.1 5-formyltetrahydrofolate cyclo-ligase [Pseudohalocynthiibacter aestuariivivens]MCK0101335.1 5-formyltetrahydrofolate cyclo-ligase [Pseudohalocynthiibacter sp. F2068]